MTSPCCRGLKTLLLKIYTFERIIITAVLNPDAFRLRSGLFRFLNLELKKLLRNPQTP